MSDQQLGNGGTAAQPSPPATAPTEREERERAITTPRRAPARLGTIVWGLLITAFAVVVALTTDLVEIEDPTAWLIGGLVAGGVALLAAGIAASVRRAN